MKARTTRGWLGELRSRIRRPVPDGAPAPRRPAGWVGFVPRDTQLQVRDVATGEVRHQPDVNG